MLVITFFELTPLLIVSTRGSTNRPRKVVTVIYVFILGTYSILAVNAMLLKIGKVGITNVITFAEPVDNTNASIEAAERTMQFGGGWFANPIWGGNGDYPDIMISKVC